MNNFYSYIRISTGQQDFIRQDSIITEFCNKNNYFLTDTYKEKVTGTKNFKERRLNELIDRMESGDILIVESFSRLARTSKQLFELFDIFEKKGIKLISLKENIDLTKNDPQTKLLIGMFSILAQFERDLTAQRTAEMLAVLKSKNIKLGRKDALKSKENILKKTFEMYLKRDTTGLSVDDICRVTKIAKSTFYKYLPTLEEKYKEA